VSNDPLHPYIPNGTGKQPTYRITDLTNPNLKPWAKEQMKKDNDDAPRQDRIHAARATSRCGVSTSVCRTRYGESIGHYEGDALVVDTIGRTIKPSSTITGHRTLRICTSLSAGR
jgi:hypothetical protein